MKCRDCNLPLVEGEYRYCHPCARLYAAEARADDDWRLTASDLLPDLDVESDDE